MALFNKKSQVTTTDNTNYTNNTWQTEVISELKVLINALETHSPDYKTVAVVLRGLHLDYYADKLVALGYHVQAKNKNPNDDSL